MIFKQETTPTVLLALVMIVIALLLFREFNRWYQRINNRIVLLERTNELLIQILAKSEVPHQQKRDVIRESEKVLFEKVRKQKEKAA